MCHFWRNFMFTTTVTIFQLSPSRGSAVRSTALSSLGVPDHNVDLENVTQASSKCVPMEYELKDVTLLGNNDVVLKSTNSTLSASEYKMKNGRIFACLPLHLRMENTLSLNCSQKFRYLRHEFRVLPNGSAIVGINAVPAGEYELSGDELLKCVPEEDDPSTRELTLQEFSIYVGQVGSVISVVSLVAHLCTFIFVPSLRNPPGYNLASLSVAFLLAYSWVLIGQIPQVLGLACVVSAVLEQNFFLAAFFFTNVLAFDVFRTLKLATGKLMVASRISRKRQFLWYSLYAWGSPAVITTISVVMDNSSEVPEVIKPGYARHDVCGITNKLAKAVFFAAPAFTLILVNSIFFVMSSWIISSNTMKVTHDETKQNVRINYVLYLRLAIMMGVTWLLGIIAIIAHNDVIWFVFDLLNSLQGLFLFLLFTCTKKVFKQLSMRFNIFQLHSAKITTLTSDSTAVSTLDSNGVTLSQIKSLA